MVKEILKTEINEPEKGYNRAIEKTNKATSWLFKKTMKPINHRQT